MDHGSRLHYYSSHESKDWARLKTVLTKVVLRGMEWQKDEDGKAQACSTHRGDEECTHNFESKTWKEPLE
jgi:hypothetical protein